MVDCLSSLSLAVYSSYMGSPAVFCSRLFARCWHWDSYCTSQTIEVRSTCLCVPGKSFRSNAPRWGTADAEINVHCASHMALRDGREFGDGDGSGWVGMKWISTGKEGIKKRIPTCRRGEAC